MNDRTINLVLLLVLVPLALLMFPLASGRVAPNKSYGYRTPASLRSDADWYRANRIAGRAGLILCLANFTLDGLVLAGVLTVSAVLRILFLLASFLVLFMYVEGRLRLF